MNVETFGFLSVIPPVVAIVLAIRTKQVLLSLILGLLVGYVILAEGNIGAGSLLMIDAIVDVFASAGNTRTILFTLLIGSLISLIKYSGGVDGFVHRVQKIILRSKKPNSRLQVAAGLTGFLIFIESNISILTVGTVFQSLFKRFRIPKEKLAYLADSSSAPSCILFPLNGWGAYIMGLLTAYEGIPPFQTLIKSIPYNFYPILTLGMVFYLATSNKSFGPMKKFELAAAEGTDEEEENQQTDTKEGKARHMLIPLGIMIISMPAFLVLTGWDTSYSGSLFDKTWFAISNASGSASVLYAVTLAVVAAGIYYGLIRKVTLKSYIDESMAGMRDMLEMATLMMLAFAIGGMCNALGTGPYVASVTESWLSPALAPAVIFITSCFIAFSTGTSWGTFAIMVSIAVPLAQAIDLNIYIALAAVLGGGVFGDHCSPISDTTLIASMASGSNHIDHVRTQLPYALFTGGLAILLYLVMGFLYL